MAACLFCSLRAGIIIYSLLSLLVYIIKLVMLTYLLFSYDNYEDAWHHYKKQSLYIVMLTLTIPSLLNCLLLLFGAIYKSETILRTWLCFSFVLLLLIACESIYNLYEADIVTFMLSTAEMLISGVGYSCVFCNLEELSIFLESDDEASGIGDVEPIDTGDAGEALDFEDEEEADEEMGKQLEE